jgi:hypothetical protein
MDAGLPSLVERFRGQPEIKGIAAGRPLLDVSHDYWFDAYFWK